MVWPVEGYRLQFVSRCLRALSQAFFLATISVAGMLDGATVKFNPFFFSNDTTVSLRGREDKFITHLFLST